MKSSTFLFIIYFSICSVVEKFSISIIRFAPNINTTAPTTPTNESINSKWLYEFVADLWSNLLPQSALTTLRESGYYAYIQRSGLRIIVLNNNLCFCHNM